MRHPTLPSAALAAASVVLLGSTAAYASHTQLTVDGSAAPASIPATLDNVNDITFDTNFGVPFTCETANADVAIERGASVAVGEVIGSLQQMALTDCTTFLLYDVSWEFRTSDISVRTHPAYAGDPVEVDVAVDATVTDNGSGRACNFDVEGSVRAELLPGDTGADAHLTLQNGLDAEVTRAGSAGSSCFGEIYEGDLMEATGVTFAVTTTGPNAGLIDHG